MAPGACKNCQAALQPVSEAQRRRGKGQFCSLRCAALWAHAHGGIRQRRRFWQDNPDLEEFVGLVFPHASNTDIAQLVGLTPKQVERFGNARGLRKDEAWMREHGYVDHGPQDPALRRVWALQRTLKCTVTKRTKELAHD